MDRTRGLLCAGVCLALGIGFGFAAAKMHSARDVVPAAPEIGIGRLAENVYLPEEKEELRKMLFPVLGAMRDDSDLEKVRKILRHQAEFALFESFPFDTTREQFRAWIIYRDMRLGKVGHQCPGHADMFLGILEIYGLEGRRILGESVSPQNPEYSTLVSKNAYSSHSTAEVKVDGRWILADPTYYVLPKHAGKHISHREGVEALCRDPSVRFEFESVSSRYPLEAYYKGRPTSDYFRDMLFARVIEYKPFHKYPYDDVYKYQVLSAHGPLELRASLGAGITREHLTPAQIPAALLRREPRPAVPAMPASNRK